MVDVRFNVEGVGTNGQEEDADNKREDFDDKKEAANDRAGNGGKGNDPKVRRRNHILREKIKDRIILTMWMELFMDVDGIRLPTLVNGHYLII